MTFQKPIITERIKSRQLKEMMQRLTNPNNDESWQRLDKLA